LKLSIKLAGIFASGAFVMVSLVTYANRVDPTDLLQLVSTSLQYIVGYLTGSAPSIPDTGVDTSLSNPLKVFQWGVFGALVGGAIGYMMGNILENPEGPPKQPAKPKQRPRQASVSFKDNTAEMDDMVEKAVDPDRATAPVDSEEPESNEPATQAPEEPRAEEPLPPSPS
jgi:hypothetical protein